MKTALRNQNNQLFKLVIDVPGLKSEDKPVLARMLLHEGLSAWNLEDLRLAPNASASPYYCASAEDYWSTWNAKNEREAFLVKRHLKEFVHLDLEKPLEITWSTFNGIVRGKRPSEMGLAKHFRTDFPHLHTRSEGMAIMKSIADFWAAQPINERDPDAAKIASGVKIVNNFIQPNESSLRFEVVTMPKLAKPPGSTVQALIGAPAMGSSRANSVAATYSCVEDPHLHGFEPVGSFSRMVKSPPESGQHANVYAECWLLLHKGGKLFVDHLKGTDPGRGYGLRKDPPLLSDMSLPTDAYDALKELAYRRNLDWPHDQLAQSSAPEVASARRIKP